MAAVVVVEAVSDAEAADLAFWWLREVIYRWGPIVGFDPVVPDEKAEVHFNEEQVDHAAGVKRTENLLDWIDPDWHLSVRILPTPQT
ncbi:MAG: hypothetical protein WBQ41_04470 [Solirubrobacterales bacterium]